MKRLLTALFCLLLTLCVVLALAACDSATPRADDDDDEKTSTSEKDDATSTVKPTLTQTVPALDEDPAPDDETAQNTTGKNQTTVTQPVTGGRTIEQAIRQYLEGMATGDSAKMLEVMADKLVAIWMERYNVSTVSDLTAKLNAEFDPATDTRVLGDVRVERRAFGEAGVADYDTYLQHLQEGYDITEDDFDEVVVVEIFAELDGQTENTLCGMLRVGNTWYMVFGVI